MTTFVYENNAQTTLAASISSSATTGTLALGTGALFPSLAAGEIFSATLIPNATTLTPTEIVYVTSISGDVVTMERGQEGTNAAAWSSGAVFSNNLTAAGINSFSQGTVANGSGILSSQGQFVPFGVTFSTAPSVVCTDSAGFGNPPIITDITVYAATNVTTTGFYLNAFRWNGTQFVAITGAVFNWIAALG